MSTELNSSTFMPEAGPAEGTIVSMRQDEVSLLDVLMVLAKRKVMIMRMTAGVTLIALVVSLLLPNRYAATTNIMPPQQSPSLAAALAAQLGGNGVLGAVAGKDLGLKNPNDLYVGLLGSRSVADALIKRFDLLAVYKSATLSDARKALDDSSEIQSGKEGFITVSVTDRDPRRAAALANGYVEELRNLMSSIAVTEAGQRRLFFEQQLRNVKDELENAEVSLKETQQKTGIIQLDSQASAIIDSIASIRAQIASKEVQLKAMQSFATAQNPDVVLLQEELAGLRVQRAKLERQQNIGGGDIQVPTSKVPEVGLEYVRRVREVKYYETMFELIAKQLEAARLDEARQGAVIQVVDVAVAPEKKTSPKRLVIVIIGFLIGGVISLSWALTAEGVRRVYRDQEQMQKLQHLKALLRSEPKRQQSAL